MVECVSTDGSERDGIRSTEAGCERVERRAGFEYKQKRRAHVPNGPGWYDDPIRCCRAEGWGGRLSLSRPLPAIATDRLPRTNRLRKLGPTGTSGFVSRRLGTRDRQAPKIRLEAQNRGQSSGCTRSPADGPSRESGQRPAICNPAPISRSPQRRVDILV